MKGVKSTAVGYSGGHKQNATYRQVCGGGTGHAEVVLIEFDPKEISYEALLRTFFKIHSPTLNYSDQYRSAIFTFGPDQVKVAEGVKAGLKDSYPKPIATQIAPAGEFWKAEDYHQRYYEEKGYAPESAVCAAPLP